MSMLLPFPILIVLWTTFLSIFANGQVLSTSSRWIVNSSGQRVKLRCVNWTGSTEARIPEGLQWQPLATITAWIANNNFNCVRLTYSIDMALNPKETVSAAFTAAASSTGAGSSLTSVYTTAVGKNPWLSSSTTLGAFGEVITSLGSHGIMVILDNHVSHASWCCSNSDGNGWWASAAGYTAANSQYFIVADWLAGLKAMATFAKSYSNVIGLSLRNELRAVGSQDQNSHADWYTYVEQGISAIHGANANALVIVGGVNYALDLSFIYSKTLPKSTLGVTTKLVWEFHNYQWSGSGAGADCTTFKNNLGSNAGYLLTQNEAYTGPLWLSEFGWQQVGTSEAELQFAACLVTYMEGNDADWAVWALQGSYYVRSGTANYDESYGILNHDWSGWRNATFVKVLGTMWNINQTP
jgi:endoglucanase